MIKRFGYRRVLVINTLRVDGFIADFSLVDASTPHAVIIGYLAPLAAFATPIVIPIASSVGPRPSGPATVGHQS